MIAEMQESRHLKKIKQLLRAIEDDCEFNSQRCELLLLYIRQYLEERGNATTYPNLSFACDLIVHHELSYNHHLSVLRDFSTLITNNKSEGPLINAMQDAIPFRKTLVKLFEFASNNDLRSSLFSGQESPRVIAIAFLEAIQYKLISCTSTVYDAYGDLDRLELGKLKVGNDILDVISFYIFSVQTPTNMQVFRSFFQTIVRINDRIEGRGRVGVVGNYLLGLCGVCGSDEVIEVLPNLATCTKCGTQHDIGLSKKG